MTQAVNEWNTYRRLIGFARPYVPRLLAGVVFGALFGTSTPGLILGLKKTIASAFDPQTLSVMEVLGVSLFMLVFAVVRGVGDYLSTYFIEWVGNRVVMDLRTASFGHLQDLSLDYYTRSRTGEIISRVTNDTTQVEKAVSTVLGDLAKQPFALVSTVALLVYLDPMLALIGLVLFPICIVPVALFGRRVRRFAREGQQRLADLVSVLQEAVAGVRIVKAFGMEGYESSRFLEQCRAVFNRAMRVTRAKAAVEPIIMTISIIGLVLVLGYVRKAHMSVDQFFAFSAAMVALYDPIKKLSKIHINVQQSSAAADRIFELIDAPVSVKDLPGAADFRGKLATIAYEDVSFAYGERPVLDRVNIYVRAGQCIALVGSSGSGKSTLVSLLPRFFDVTGGHILVNGRDVREYTLRSLRQLIGIVTQETFLFNDTIANNIAYGQTDAPRAAIEEAARKALAHEFILQKEQGYDTVIGERGVQLSGGQAQRLSIARAILRNPPILILDEATSALDTESERQVQAALNELMSGRTVFAIAHRLSTVQHADMILVLDEGRIVERGTHGELLAKGGSYKYYHDLQFRDAATVTSVQ